MCAFFSGLFEKKGDTVDLEKIKNQASLSFEKSQFDKNLFLLYSENAFNHGYHSFVCDSLKLKSDNLVSVNSELNRLREYIDFFKSVHTTSFFYKLEVKNVDDISASLSLQPFVLFPLVMNALYLGYNTMETFPMRIRIQVIGSRLKLEVSNRVNHHLVNQEKNEELDWFKSRLELLYTDKYSLLFNSNSNLFKSTLLLDLKNI